MRFFETVFETVGGLRNSWARRNASDAVVFEIVGRVATLATPSWLRRRARLPGKAGRQGGVAGRELWQARWGGTVAGRVGWRAW